jgi:parallel beta-helix repeat protein
MVSISLLWLTQPQFCLAKTIYVATTGADSNPGSQSAPLRNIQRAVQLVSAGDTVLVRGGSYAEQVIIKVSGTAGNLITLKPEPGTGTVFIKHPTTQPLINTPIIELSPASYIRIEGFYFKDSLTSIAIRMNESTKDVNFQTVKTRVIGNQIANNVFENIGFDVQPATEEIIKMFQTQEILVENNQFINCFGFMIAPYYSYKVTMRGNEISGMRGHRPSWATDLISSGIWQGGPRSTFEVGDTYVIGGDNLIEDNYIHDSKLPTGQSTAIRLDAGAHSTVITRNRVHDVNYAIYLESRANSNIVKENICYNNDFGFTTASSSTAYPAKNNLWLNNVAYNNAKYGFCLRNTINSVLKNNISFNNRTSQVMTTVQAVTGGVTFGNNLWFNSSNSSIGVWGCALNIYNGKTTDGNCTNGAPANLSLSQWTAASHETGGLSVNPQFVNLTVGAEDFHLGASSPARGAGEGSMDMGAYPQNDSTGQVLSAPQGLRIVP